MHRGSVIRFILLAGLGTGLVSAAQPLSMRYQFLPGRPLRYRTERQESVLSASGARTFIGFSEETLSAGERQPDGSVRLSAKTDTAWSDETSSGEEGNRWKDAFGFLFTLSERTFGIDGRGMAVKPVQEIPDFFIPLPEPAVNEGADWNFRTRTPLGKPGSGFKTAQGRVVFAATENRGGIRAAVLSAHTETRLEKSRKIEEPFRTIDVVFMQNETREEVGYLDVQNGTMTGWMCTASFKSELRTGGETEVRTGTRRVTVRLINPEAFRP